MHRYSVDSVEPTPLQVLWVFFGPNLYLQDTEQVSKLSAEPSPLQVWWFGILELQLQQYSFIVENFHGSAASF